MLTSNSNPIVFNQELDSLLEKNASEVSEGIRSYIHTELQEGSFARSILKPQPITTADCQVNLADNSLYVVREIESDGNAIAVDNLGTPNGSYISGERYMIPIINLATDRFQITEQDLRAYRHPITKRIQEKSVPILHKLEDKYFLRLVGAAIAGASAGEQKVYQGYDQTNELELNQRDFINLKNTLASGINGSDDKRKEVACMLMTQEDYETSVLLPGASDDFGKDRIIEGINSETLFGTRIVKTIKSNVLPRGHVFAFTSQDFLGHAFTLGETKFEIKKEFGLIQWETRMSVGYGIGNASAVALLTLNGAKAPGTNTVLDLGYTSGKPNKGTVTADIVNYYKSLTL